MKKLREGDRVYYTGDQANFEGFGRVESGDGRSVNIRFTDGRFFRLVSVLAFEPGSGRRFYPLAEYRAERAQQMAELKRNYLRVVART